MKISVITAVYNAERYVRSALDSILEQQAVDVECVVIDGGSTDNTVQIVESYGDRIDVFVSEPDGGIYDALNKGLRLARGDVVGFLHADDMLADPGALARVRERFAASPRAVAVYGDLEYVASDDASRVLRRWCAGPFKPSSLRWGWMPPHPTLYFRRELVSTLGEFDVGLRIAADYEWMLRLLRSGRPVEYVPSLQVRMRVGGASNRSLKNVVHKSSEDWIALRRHGWGSAMATITLLAKNLRKLPQFITASKAPS